MNLFYCTGINSECSEAFLSEEESIHALRVLRLKTGDKIIFTDGKGMFYEGALGPEKKKAVSVKIIRSIADKAKRNFQLTIAIAPTKNIDRFEWFLEKATELGCDEIMPIACRHSERHAIKTERLNKILVSAMKQCLKSQIPLLHELEDFKKFIGSSEQFSGQKFIGHIPELSVSEFPPQNPTGRPLTTSCKKGENILIAIGPEGGFSDEEVSAAEKADFLPIRLGNSRLRVETAGIAACTIINAVNA